MWQGKAFRGPNLGVGSSFCWKARIEATPFSQTPGQKQLPQEASSKTSKIGLLLRCLSRESTEPLRRPIPSPSVLFCQCLGRTARVRRFGFVPSTCPSCSRLMICAPHPFPSFATKTEMRYHVMVQSCFGAMLKVSIAMPNRTCSETFPIHVWSQVFSNLSEDRSLSNRRYRAPVGTECIESSYILEKCYFSRQQPK